MLNTFENQIDKISIMTKKVHKGAIIKEAAYKSRVPIVKIAELVGKARGTVYSDFEDENLSNEDILKYGEALGVDFSKQIPSLLEFNTIKETQAEYKKQKNYMQLYYDLLEDHVALIKEVDKLRKAAPSEPGAPKVRQTKKKK